MINISCGNKWYFILSIASKDTCIIWMCIVKITEFFIDEINRFLQMRHRKNGVMIYTFLVTFDKILR